MPPLDAPTIAGRTLPTGPEGLTPDWLGAVLGRPVQGVRATRIGEDESFAGGAIYRLEMPGEAALVAKFSPLDARLRQAFARSNAREVAFYTGLSRNLPVPHCHFGAFDPASGHSLLLLQDLSAGRTVAFLDGMDAADTEAALRALARIHAACWNAPALQGLSGSSIASELPFGNAWARYGAALTERMPDVTLTPRLQALGRHAVDHAPAILHGLLDAGPCTVLHRDPHVDNILFGKDGSARFIDWQLMGRGRGTWDVTYLLISSVVPDLRRRHEHDWLALYHAALTAQGVTGYSLAECRRDYLRAVIGKLCITVAATVFLDSSTPHKQAWRRADLDRLTAFVEDHALSPAIWQDADAR